MDNSRLKELRTTLNLNQEEFGKKLGVTRSAIAKIEIGDRNLTEQMTKSICREYNVNYAWLLEGKGDMFTGLPETIFEEMAEEYNLDDMDKKIIRNYLKLSHDKRMIIKEYLQDIFLGEKKDEQ